MAEHTLPARMLLDALRAFDRGEELHLPHRRRERRSMTETEAHLSQVYLDAFADRAEWTQEDHLAGLKAVFVAGASAQARLEQSTTERESR